MNNGRSTRNCFNPESFSCYEVQINVLSQWKCTLCDASENQFIEQSATVSTVTFKLVWDIFSSFGTFLSGQSSHFVLLLLASMIQGHQRRVRGKAERKREGTGYIQYDMLLVSRFFVVPVLCTWFSPLPIVHSRVFPLF